MSSSRRRPAPTWSWWTAWRAGPPRRRRFSRTTPASRPWPPSVRRARPARIQASTGMPIPEAAERVANFLHAMTLEIQMLARACGKADVHDLEPEDLRALTLEASAITGLPLVGTRWVPGRGREL